jgi:hypothetical protein
MRSVDQMLQNGVLDIQVPVLEASKPKQIQIQTGKNTRRSGRRTLAPANRRRRNLRASDRGQAVSSLNI